LDPDAVEKAVQSWSEADRRRRVGPDPEALSAALLRMQLPQQQSASPAAQPGGHLLLDMAAPVAGAGLDLVAMGIHAIGRLFERGD
jgi:hypothetical protein